MFNVHIQDNGRFGSREYETTAAVDLDDMLRTLIDQDEFVEWEIKLLLDGVYTAEGESSDAIIHAVTQEDRDALDAVILKIKANDGLMVIVDDEDEDEDQKLITGAPRFVDDGE